MVGWREVLMYEDPTTDYQTIEIFALFEGFLAPNHPEWREIPSRGRKSFLAVDLVISY
jgi:hypothetical protein